MFQSSPTPKGGRYLPSREIVRSHCSFNPRPPRKVGATSTRHYSVLRSTRFNPRPPRKVGATMVKQTISRILHVSILAHPERWALRYGECTNMKTLPFQSSPTPKGGRYSARSVGRAAPSGFNPRPPRKVGATVGRVGAGSGVSVSILAHPERWALQ